MNLVSGVCLCVLCGWLTASAQVMPTSNCSGEGPSPRRVSSAQLLITPNAAYENAAIPDRSDIERQIDQTENALGAIRRPLNFHEQKAATQIQAFITKARKALDADDLDGAHTLATKARLLLLDLRRGHPEQKAKLKPV